MAEQVSELESQALSLPDQAKSLVIVDAQSYELAGEFLLKVKGVRSKINETFDPIIGKAFSAHKEAVAQKKKVEAPLLQAEAYLKPLMASYVNEQERKRREEEARLQAEARKKAEDEALARAEKEEKAGNHEKAEKIINQPIQQKPVILPTETPKLAGVSFRQQWKFRITDEELIPREYLTPDMVKIGGVIRAMKGNTNIPGIQAYPDQVVSAGREGVMA